MSYLEIDISHGALRGSTAAMLAGMQHLDILECTMKEEKGKLRGKQEQKDYVEGEKERVRRGAKNLSIIDPAGLRLSAEPDMLPTYLLPGIILVFWETTRTQ